jgi:putative restriction endonuclease
MKFYIGVTDNEWFNFLRSRKPDEVNFWRPGAQNFAALSQGDAFLFKLHAPQNYIAGGGFFFKYTRLPVTMAWKVFQEENGCSTYNQLARKIFSYQNIDRRSSPDPDIGCIILVVPFFFEESDWIPAPRDWSQNIVAGKTYDSESAIGKELWDRVELNLRKHKIGTLPLKPGLAAEPSPRYGTKHLVDTRLGQGAFRANIIDVYGRRCSVSGEKTLPVLEAAHIKPYASSGPHSTQNGLLLRADLHILLDQGYITVANDYKVEISRRIKADFENGRDYYKYHGQSLAVLPGNIAESPGREFLEWHRENVYRG